MAGSTVSVTAGLAALGIDRVVLLGGDPALRAAVTRHLGPGVDDLWTLERTERTLGDDEVPATASERSPPSAPGALQ